MSLHARIRQEDGFTLWEVLLTILILAILSGLALATFSGKDQLAMDAEAKSNARGLLSQVQACHAEREDYTLCDERSELADAHGVAWGTGPGQVEVRRNGSHTTRDRVTVRAYSRARSGGSSHTFTIVRDDAGERQTCASDGANTAGGCDGGSW